LETSGLAADVGANGGVNVFNGSVVSISEGAGTGSGVLVIVEVGGRLERMTVVSLGRVGDGDAGPSKVGFAAGSVADGAGAKPSDVFGADGFASNVVEGDEVGSAGGLDAPGAGGPPPRTLFATPSSTQPTITPSVLFIGIAKHLVPASQVVMTKFPAALQLPILPEMQAICPDAHLVEKLIVEKKLLYA
jgi:hypothetical protein